MTKAEQFLKARQESIKTVEVLLPDSGIAFTLRRPSLKAWVLAGHLPPFFNKEVRDAWGVAAPALQTSQGSIKPEVRDQWLIVMRGLVEYACVSPRMVVDGKPEDDEIDPSFLSEIDQSFLWNWIVTGSPGIPVNDADDEDKELHVEDVRQFPSQPGRGQSVFPQSNGGAVSSTPESTLKFV